ncbi:phosphopentomutase [Bosea sp. (in: a-proteobacteria)]|uniref:phosphopentomutase n=1 Tax=Bosea sp. (in: a-proteobacteria) TaxID=1871050 RepID=UPI0025C5A756|nr:phosphopentomutase [Bosea sp. (in: a-proteobacteria)]MBR3190275.1 phosphopentomutase [Bosea sp. (in: a-proteobacteria)]
MARAILIVLDSVGCGGAEDAAAYGDEGSDTLGHIAEACAEGRGDRDGLRSGPLDIPNLARLGLSHACEASTGRPLAGVTRPEIPQGRFGYGVEVSQGKDTPSGHWEIAGCPVPFKWGYFTALENTFPPDLVAAIIREGALPGILGNKHASGTAVIDELAEEHISTGKPICYTSVDSVLQIAAHEEHFGLERLYALCKKVRILVDPLRIGRVIARPFVGTTETGFTRTGNRKDFAIPPPDETILDRMVANGRPVVTVGKIGDIFAHRNTGEEIKPFGNAAMFAAALEAFERLPDGGFCFVNLVDFDTEYGHRRDIPGYAAALEAFDRDLPKLEALLKPGDLTVITADHGNDPSWPGSDHTREHVPILAFGPGVAAGPIGRRESFSDIAATLGDWLKLGAVGPGRTW